MGQNRSRWRRRARRSTSAYNASPGRHRRVLRYWRPSGADRSTTGRPGTSRPCSRHAPREHAQSDHNDPAQPRAATPATPASSSCLRRRHHPARSIGRDASLRMTPPQRHGPASRTKLSHTPPRRYRRQDRRCMTGRASKAFPRATPVRRPLPLPRFRDHALSRPPRPRPPVASSPSAPRSRPIDPLATR